MCCWRSSYCTWRGSPTLTTFLVTASCSGCCREFSVSIARVLFGDLAFDLTLGHLQQLFHLAPDEMIGNRDAARVEIATDFFEDVFIARPLEIRGHDFLGVGIGGGTDGSHFG